MKERIVSDKSVPTYFKAALHAGLRAERFARLARSKSATTKKRCEWRECERIERRLADYSWRRFCLSDSRKPVRWNPRNPTRATLRALEMAA